MHYPRRSILRAAAIGAALSTLTALPALAQAQAAFPNKPIRIIVGFAPGGGTDIVARALAPRMSEILGQPVVIENRSGASGTIAADVVAKSAADGYTLLMGHSNSNAIAPFVLPKVPYDAGSDFSPITYVGYVPNVLVTHPSVPAKSVKELIDIAKKKPGGFTLRLAALAARSTWPANCSSASPASTWCTSRTAAAARRCRTCWPATST